MPDHDGILADSTAALRWAAAIRPPGRDADALDLLEGIMLADLRNSPPRQLFEHFDILPGSLLARDERPLPEAEALLAAYGQLSETLPPTSSANDVIIRDARSRSSIVDGPVSLHMLFYSLLATSNPASAGVRDRLNYREVKLDVLLGSYLERLTSPGVDASDDGSNASGGETFVEFLQRLHPYTATPVQLPAYQPDRPMDRRPPVEPSLDPTDLVGITAEVDAFAYLIASKKLVPPLAVGLFGDWGGGKSYFLRNLQRRVDKLIGERGADHALADLPFYRSIVQIEYNAWQYVGGDLWSSLLEHLFRNLPLGGDQSDKLLMAKRLEVIEKLSQSGDARDEARFKRGRLEGERRVAAAEVQRCQSEREVALAKLHGKQLNRVAVTQSLAAVKEAVSGAGFGAVATEAEGLADELGQARASLQQAGPLLAILRAGGWRTIAVVVCILLTPVIAVVLSLLNVSTVTAVAGTVAWLLATAAGYVRAGNKYLQSALSKIQEAQRQLDEETNAPLSEATKELQELDTDLREAADKERALAVEAAALEVKLAKITPGKVLMEFINERLGSDDYRMRLGVPALVRRDLERLSDLIDARHRENSPGDDPGIDRIVLYIDDLDRCPTSLVVNVLQAVHLLLSFPLFVVVVAVDARWVAHSLRDHYRQLEGEDASPEDFIEKIFQVPFWVRPLTPTARKSMIRGLIAPSLAPERPADTTPRQDNATPAVPEADMEVFEELVASFGDTTGKDPEWLADAALTVSRDELTWMERVAPLLGNTPRAIKRFANIYLLLRSIGRGRGWPVPPGGELVVLLAIGTNLPHLAERMFSDAVPDKSLKVAAKPDDSDSDPERTAERARLSDWLVKAPEARIPDGPRLDDWVELIRRFRFSRVEQPLTASSAG